MKRFFLPLTLALAILFMGYIYWPRAVTETSLTLQLQGDHCRFAYNVNQYEQRGLDPLRSLLVEEHNCDMWAIQCLVEFRSAQTSEAMLWVLEHKSDVETCDGTRPIRSSAVQYLGEHGDPSAIPALTRLKNSKPTARLSSGASGCIAKSENLDKIQEAITKITSR